VDKPIALVTGANKGIGLETARQLARKGYTVMMGSRDASRGRAAADTLKSEGLDAHFIALDVTSEESIQHAAEQVGRRFGRLDALINNAGVLMEPWSGNVSDAKMSSLRATFDVNFFGLVAVTQAFLPLVKKSKAGRIVNLTSILGSLAEHSDPKSPIHGNAAMGYSASKAAVNMFTVNLAHELRETPIKVNAAHPGWVKTDMGTEAAPLETPEGSETSVWLATLPADGPTGGYFHKRERVRW
jgi:NAD(P)-dependent dehydrogenase (short-subunit alcohol dehydrogenase family)